MKKVLPFLLIVLFAGCNSLYYNLRKKPDKFQTEKHKSTLVTEGENEVFKDDFNTGKLSTDWKPAMFWSGPVFHQETPESGYYARKNIEFTENTVKLWTRYTPKMFYNELTGDSVLIDYSLGLLDLYPWVSNGNEIKNNFLVECSAKMPVGNDEWPAFWITSYEQWPPEVDIFEYWRNDIGEFTTNFHYTKKESHEQMHKKHQIPWLLKNDFHVYGLKVTDDYSGTYNK